MAGNPHYAGLFNLGDENAQTDKVRYRSGDIGIYTYPLIGSLTLSAKLKDLPVEERNRVEGVQAEIVMSKRKKSIGNDEVMVRELRADPAYMPVKHIGHCLPCHFEAIVIAP